MIRAHESKNRLSLPLPKQIQTEKLLITRPKQQDKLVQVNNKLKRALQTMKDKINRFALEQSELFPNPTDDTLMRLDQLIVTLEQLKHDKVKNNE